jgi:hypothetical protein
MAKENPSAFWKAYRKKPETTHTITNRQWYTSYKTLLGKVPANDTQPKKEGNSATTPIDTTNSPAKYAELDLPITENEVKDAIHKLRNNKAAGIDGITAELICDAADLLLSPLTKAFNHVFFDEYPAECAVGVIHPIFKAGNINEPNNYRGICVGPVIGKLFAMILESRITEWAEEQGIRAKGQAGFRKDYRTSDHIFIMRTMIEKRKKEKGKLYCCFVDFKKAFDSIPRDLLWQELAAKGITGKMLQCIKSIYAHDSARVSNGIYGLTDPFKCEMGVKQGCPLSPLLFGLYIDQIETRIFNMKDHSAFPKLAGTQIPVLLYADDLALFSHTEEGLQKQIKELDMFCTEYELEVNTKKTKTTIFESKKSKCQNFTYKGENIERVESFKYLGIEFHATKGFNHATNQLYTAANKSLHAMYQRCLQLHINDPITKCKLFDALIVPILQYSCEVWAVDHNHQSCSLEKIHKKISEKNDRIT